ncbi:MAG: ATP phosphoribosyltransferase regulatory subunit [Pseudomonadota bacterium]
MAQDDAGVAMNVARAYLADGRLGAGLARVEDEVARLLDRFERAGAVRIDPGALLDAEVLLDLYGEDIRGRAYTIHDPVDGERMLRPDFTVPVVQMHGQSAIRPARYAYAGPVWRRQEPGSDRPTEYLQVGYELFDDGDPAAADAEVFALFADALAVQELAVATGDLGVVQALVEGLETSAARKAALLRHVWRPRRFRRLLDRYSTAQEPSARRDALLRAAARGEAALAAHVAEEGPVAGLRRIGEITARAAVLKEELETPPLSPADVARIDAVLELRGSYAHALRVLEGLTREAEGLDDVVERMARRGAALAAAGITLDTLPFEASFARTRMEYYDGFVFGFFDPARSDLPQCATGGRYDALTRALSGADGLPAVGGIVRPEVLLARGAGQ